MPDTPKPIGQNVSSCRCPFCDIESPAWATLCAGCGVQLRWCAECGQVAAWDASVCTSCGKPLV